MNLQNKLELAQSILVKYIDLYSQEDEFVIKGTKVDHPWLEEIQNLNQEDKILFDAKRDSTKLIHPEWAIFTRQLNELRRFEKIPDQPILEGILGKDKKRHELTQLDTLLKPYNGLSTIDFGGGVGNLAHFLENSANMRVHVIEQNEKLISKGQEKLKKLKSKTSTKSC